LPPLAGQRAGCDLSPTASRQLWHVPWDALAFARQAATSSGHRKLSMYAYSVSLPTGVIGGPAGQQMRPRRTTGTAQQGPPGCRRGVAWAGCPAVCGRDRRGRRSRRSAGGLGTHCAASRYRIRRVTADVQARGCGQQRRRRCAEWPGGPERRVLARGGPAGAEEKSKGHTRSGAASYSARAWVMARAPHDDRAASAWQFPRRTRLMPTGPTFT
jgi:hypothetical protein